MLRYWLACLILCPSLGSAADRGAKDSSAPPTQCERLLSDPRLRTEGETPSFVLNSASRTHSQIVRDNAFDYWTVVRRTVDASQWWGLPTILRRSLLVVGDMHPGNFAIVPVSKNKLHYTLYDIKDLGVGSALFDLNHLIMRTIAVAIRNHNRPLSSELANEIATKLLKSYRNGLSASTYSLTEDFSARIPSYASYAKDLAGKNESAIGKGQFELQLGKIESLKGAAETLNTTIEKLRQELELTMVGKFGAGRLLDAAVRVKDRGGSVNSLRIWVSFERKNGERLFKEFKEITSPASAGFESQPPFVEVIDAASRFLDYDIMVVSPVVSLAGREFFMRDRKIEYLSVPYRQGNRSERQQLLKMAEADAQWLGTFHGLQLATAFSRSKFIEAFDANTAQILAIINKINLSYLGGISDLVYGTF